MRKSLKRKNRWKRGVRILLCVLFLTGCSQPGPDRGTGQEHGDTSEAAVPESPAFMPDAAASESPAPMPEVSEESGEERSEEGSAQQILARLIRDEGFRDCVWYEADIDSQDTEERILDRLNQCEELVLKRTANRSTLHSLEALSYLPNLKSLVIDFDSWEGSGVADFTPIAGLSGLRELCINSPKEEMDLSFLAEMKQITELYLPNCQVKEMEFLKDMPQLERLSLYETKVEDLAVLENLQGLAELALGGNSHARNMETVGKLGSLQDLGLQNCGIRDIAFVRELTELHSINLNTNSITDLTPLTGLTKLERLGLAENQIRDISPLESLTNLYDLALDGNEISDLSALGGLTHLNQAGLSDNRISDLSPLAGKEELMFASVFGNPCTDLQPVWEVPLLSWKSDEPIDEKTEFAEAWKRSIPKSRNIHASIMRKGIWTVTAERIWPL